MISSSEYMDSKFPAESEIKNIFDWLMWEIQSPIARNRGKTRPLTQAENLCWDYLDADKILSQIMILVASMPDDDTEVGRQTRKIIRDAVYKIAEQQWEEKQWEL